MKINLPITGSEVLFAVDKTMVTKTDAQGIITFANLDFMEVSGFSDEELVGANQNIIRHPDMPAVVFEMMWATLKRGFTWSGIVKNRCKNGDHYWVSAKIIPIKKNGEITGYMSVRSCPSRDEVAAAEEAYKTAATAPETIASNTPASWRRHCSIRNGVPIWIVVVTLMLIAGGILGITGLNKSVRGIHALQYEELEPVHTIGRINDLMADNRAHVTLAIRQDAAANKVAQPASFVPDYIQAMVRNNDEIDRLWGAYVSRIKVAEERALAEKYRQARSQLAQDGFLSVKQAMDEANYVKADQMLSSRIGPLHEKAHEASNALLNYLTERSRAKVEEITAYNNTTVNLALGGIALCFLVLVAGGLFVYRVTAVPLENAVRALERIAEGDLSSRLGGEGYGEPGRVTDALWVTQTRLKVMMHEMRKSSKSIREQCGSLNLSMMNLAEHSDEQHDRVYQSVDAIEVSGREFEEISELMDSMLLALNTGDHGQADNAATEVKYAPVASIPYELIDIFEEHPMPAQAVAAEVATTAATTTELGVFTSTPTDKFYRHMNTVVRAARLQSILVNDLVSQLKQVASLIVKNRSDVQAAWAVSQRLEATAHELDQMVKYFD